MRILKGIMVVILIIIQSVFGIVGFFIELIPTILFGLNKKIDLLIDKIAGIKKT